MTAATPRLRDFLSGELLCFRPDTPLAAAVAIMLERNISGAPVIDAGGGLVGILTAKDCFRAALQATYYHGWQGVAADLMSSPVETLEADLDLVSAAERFLAVDFRRFPVTDDGRVVGVLMRLDLLRALNAQWS